MFEIILTRNRKPICNIWHPSAVTWSCSAKPLDKSVDQKLGIRSTEFIRLQIPRSSANDPLLRNSPWLPMIPDFVKDLGLHQQRIVSKIDRSMDHKRKFFTLRSFNCCPSSTLLCVLVNVVPASGFSILLENTCQDYLDHKKFSINMFQWS